MTIDHHIIMDGDVLLTDAYDTVDAQQMSEHMFWLVERLGKGLNVDYRHLFDATRADVQFQERDLNRVSQILLTYGQARGAVQTALVVADDKAMHMAKVYKEMATHVTGIRIEIFEERDTALRWLEVDPAAIR